MRSKPNDEPRPVCPECGQTVHPKNAVILHTLRGNEEWIASPIILKGVYCNSDHLLNAYLRGWPSALVSGVVEKPKPKRKPPVRKKKPEPEEDDE